jgi:hypothetical protein
MMQVVIEIDDYSDPEVLLAELRILQAEADRTANDPLFDPDEDGSPMALRTNEGEVEVGVARIVGVIEHPGALNEFLMTTLEA